MIGIVVVTHGRLGEEMVETLAGVLGPVAQLEAVSTVESDPEIQSFVERLERASDSEEIDAVTDVPSGDAIAREFQRFLRQRGPEQR